MNQLIETMKKHRSFRSYSEQSISEQQLDEIIQAAQWAPSWVHGQHVSIISVTDQARKSELAKLCGNQAHVEEAPIFLVFCADFYRVHKAAERAGETIVVTNDVDALLIGATDVGLAMSNAITAAESLGLGTVPIGSIRRNPMEVIALLELPRYVIPISGLCLGYPNEDPGQKPRMPQSMVHHLETYQADLDQQLVEYDQIMSDYTVTRTDGKSGANWSERIVSYYSKRSSKSTAEMLKQQGFTYDNLK